MNILRACIVFAMAVAICLLMTLLPGSAFAARNPDLAAGAFFLLVALAAAGCVAAFSLFE